MLNAGSCAADGRQPTAFGALRVWSHLHLGGEHHGSLKVLGGSPTVQRAALAAAAADLDMVHGPTASKFTIAATSTSGDDAGGMGGMGHLLGLGLGHSRSHRVAAGPRLPTASCWVLAVHVSEGAEW